MPQKSRWVVGLALSLVLAGRARAEFITFDGIAPPGQYIISEDTTRLINGFNVRLVSGAYVAATATRDYMAVGYGEDRAWFLSYAGMRISQPSGGPFAIHSFHAADWGPETPGGQKIYAFGLLADGVTVLKTEFTTPDRPVGTMPKFQTYSFGPGWDRVVDVWFRGQPQPVMGFAIDNISVTQAPEPGSLALLGSGAVTALGYAWRRRRAAR